MNAVETGKRIAALRHRKGWTQQQLAAQLHITDKAVSKWERGLNFPDLGTVEPLAAALDTSAAALLGLEQEPPDRAVAAMSELAAAEQARIRRSIRLYARVTLAIGVLLFAAQITASYLFAANGLYGAPQVLTAGMLGFTGVLTGGALYTLRHVRRL